LLCSFVSSFFLTKRQNQLCLNPNRFNTSQQKPTPFIENRLRRPRKAPKKGVASPERLSVMFLFVLVASLSGRPARKLRTKDLPIAPDSNRRAGFLNGNGGQTAF